MKALITGASSGLGKEFSKILSNMGYDLIIVARREDRLLKLKKELKTNVDVIPLDLSIEENCIKLYDQVKNEDINILINNSGFGLCGEFSELDLNKELEMININIKAVHILTKLFIKEFIKKNDGYILNVASSAAFLPGPLMATYYSTKSYVLRLTESINEELRRSKSKVHICALCPGPVRTDFNDVANVKFSVNSLSSEYVARYALNKMFKNKVIIVPGFIVRVGIFCRHFVSEKFLAKIDYNIQKKKIK